MNALRTVLALVALSGLAGCLEVEQHPAWVGGEYDGKQDDLQYQRHFHRDKLAWSAAISNRNRQQNEYSRTRP